MWYFAAHLSECLMGDFMNFAVVCALLQGLCCGTLRFCFWALSQSYVAAFDHLILLWSLNFFIRCLPYHFHIFPLVSANIYYACGRAYASDSWIEWQKWGEVLWNDLCWKKSSSCRGVNPTWALGGVTPVVKSRQRWENTYWIHLLEWENQAVKHWAFLWLSRACPVKTRKSELACF